MAQYLDLSRAQASKNDRVAFTDITLAGDFLVRCRCELYNHTTVPAGMLFSGGNSGGGVEIYRNGSLGVQLFINGTSVGTAGNLWPYTNDVDINPRYVDLRRVGSTLTVEFDGVAAITVSNSATLKINSIGSRGTGFYLGFKLYDLEIANGAFYRKYDASLAGSTGTVLATNDGVNQGTISGGAAYVEYDGGVEPPAFSTYDVGGVSPMFISGTGGASVNALASGTSVMTMADDGGASVTVSAGGGPDSAMTDSAGATLTAMAGGQSVMTMTAQGGAEVGSEITGGGVSDMTITETGGATVTARAGGAYEFSFGALGGASLNASAGGVSQAAISDGAGASLVAVAGGASGMVTSAAGGAAVNEQAVKINRVALPSVRLSTTMALPPVAMLQSVSINGQFNYRRTL